MMFVETGSLCGPGLVLFLLPSHRPCMSTLGAWHGCGPDPTDHAVECSASKHVGSAEQCWPWSHTCAGTVTLQGMRVMCDV